MTEPNFRALCAELYQEFSSLYCDMSACVDFNDSYMERIDNLCNRADAALATPPPEPPTDEQLVNFRNRATTDCCSSRSNNGANLLSDDDLVACQAAGLRAVLERWG